MYGTEESATVNAGDLAFDDSTTPYVIRETAADGTSDVTLADIVENPTWYLQEVTTFFYYDLEAWSDRGEPVQAVGLARETHSRDLGSGETTAVQVSLTYSDGFGREIQSKIKVEDGPAWEWDEAEGEYAWDDTSEARWLASGRTVYNNKEKPVKQYEPFYTRTHTFEDEEFVATFGVTPIIHYDPLLRVIRTDSPKGFFSKVEFTPWEVTSYDFNDTVTDSGYYDTYSSLSSDEQGALDKAAAHYDTPSTAHLDTLGRQYKTVQLLTTTTDLTTTTTFDITGKPLTVTDPRGNTAFTYTYDMLGNTLRTVSIDAGDDRVFANVMGNPVMSFDSRGHTITAEYDVLHRLTKKEVTGNSLNNTVEFLEYGEDVADDTQKNLRGQLYRHWDQSGMTQVSLYDIKGQPRESSKRLRAEYKLEANWDVTSEANRLALLESETFSSETEYDVLGRPTKQYNPDGSETRPEFHQSGKLDKVHIKLKGETSETDFVTGITYNAKGQREKIEYGNNTWTEYTYEDTTFRLTSLKTFRAATPDPVALQDITYVYDPVGNIVKITDDSHNKVFTTTGPVEPIQAYTYDALYRLTDATGRMHTALVNTPFFNDSSSFKQSRHTLLNNQNLIAAYGRSYAYDEVGNLETIIQTGTNPFTRHIDIDTGTNRGLLRTGVDPVPSTRFASDFDANGNQIAYDHFVNCEWNYRDNISKALIIDRTSDPDDAEYYVYDAGGQRTRKVKETWNGTVVKIDEKIYLGGVEIRRRRDQGSLTNYEDRSSLQVMDDKQRIATVHYWTAHTFSETYIPALNTNHARYQYGNHLGSASLELNDSGQIISYEEYFPYGGTSFIAGNNQAEVKLKEYRYTAKERDDSTGFYYYGARYYAPWTMRWMSPDPAGAVDGLNLYVYVSGNPVKLVDPEGMAETPVPSNVQTKRYG